MPKVKLIKEDPRKAELRALISGGMARQRMNRVDLAEQTGVNYSTLTVHIRNVEDMRLGELWKILDTLKVSNDERKAIL